MLLVRVILPVSNNAIATLTEKHRLGILNRISVPLTTEFMIGLDNIA